MDEIIEQDFIDAGNLLAETKKEIQSFIVGQEEVIDQLLWTIISGGHALLEGLPGLGKTMLIRTVAEVMDLSFSRIQFTPDLMPSDITGTMMIQPNDEGKQRFEFYEGPLFSNIILADEINRATPKTQSALLEAMGEKTVTVMGDTKIMMEPFFVLATQNPLEMEGTYPLPEAQLDRFSMKINVGYPSKQVLKEIILRTTGDVRPLLKKIMTSTDLLRIQWLAKKIIVSDELLDVAVNIVSATQPTDPAACESVKQYVQYGSGPRGLQSIITLAKARALFSGRFHVSLGDLKQVVKPALRHRLLLNFEGESAGVSSDKMIEETITSVQNSEATR